MRRFIWALSCLYLLEAAEQHRSLAESKRTELVMDPQRSSVAAEVDFNRALYERHLSEYLRCEARKSERAGAQWR